MKITLNTEHTDMMNKVFRAAHTLCERNAKADPEHYKPIIADIAEFAARWPENVNRDDEEILDIMFAAAYEYYPSQSERNKMVEFYCNLTEGMAIIG